MSKDKLIIFNFGISYKAEVFVIENGSIIYAGEFHCTAFKDILSAIEIHKHDGYCYLPKFAYTDSYNGVNCHQILISSGFRVA